MSLTNSSALSSAFLLGTGCFLTWSPACVPAAKTRAAPSKVATIVKRGMVSSCGENRVMAWVQLRAGWGASQGNNWWGKKAHGAALDGSQNTDLHGSGRESCADFLV